MYRKSYWIFLWFALGCGEAFIAAQDPEEAEDRNEGKKFVHFCSVDYLYTSDSEGDLHPRKITDYLDHLEILLRIIKQAKKEGLNICTLGTDKESYDAFTKKLDEKDFLDASKYFDLKNSVPLYCGDSLSDHKRFTFSDFKMLIEFGFDLDQLFCFLKKEYSAFLRAVKEAVFGAGYGCYDPVLRKIVEYLVQHPKVDINFSTLKSGLTALSILAYKYAEKTPCQEKEEYLIYLANLLLQNGACPHILFTYRPDGKGQHTTAYKLFKKEIDLKKKGLEHCKQNLPRIPEKNVENAKQKYKLLEQNLEAHDCRQRKERLMNLIKAKGTFVKNHKVKKNIIELIAIYVGCQVHNKSA